MSSQSAAGRDPGEPVEAVFAYGTLRRGQCRQGCWPCPPASIEPAWTRGLLYDLGAYPALIEGERPVAGELWRLRPHDLAETLRVLDRVEAVDEGLYRRVLIVCQTADGEEPAWTYVLNDRSSLAGLQPLEPDADGLCRWP